jgi:hypothetical protein
MKRQFALRRQSGIGTTHSLTRGRVAEKSEVPAAIDHINLFKIKHYNLPALLGHHSIAQGVCLLAAHDSAGAVTNCSFL